MWCVSNVLILAALKAVRVVLSMSGGEGLAVKQSAVGCRRLTTQFTQCSVEASLSSFESTSTY